VANQLGSAQRPLRVAIIGAGPSGFYTAGALLQQPALELSVDLFERLPVPHGLVRYGVAPDHQKIKTVAKIFERTATDARFRFFGYVAFGKDITHADLRRHYDQIVYAVGAQSDRKLDIPGEELPGSLSATEFVAWYNGHPDFADLQVDLQCSSAVVVGVGNVAVDVARILAQHVEQLCTTDIADHALSVLAGSQIKDIYILSRRGPAQVKFTHAELKELGELPHVTPIVSADELVLDGLSAVEIANNSEAKRNLETLHSFASRAREPEDPLAVGEERRIHFRFCVSPVALLAENGHIAGVQVEHNVLQADAHGYLNAQGTGEFSTIPAGLVLRSVGYQGIPLADVPFDTHKGIIPNVAGRILHPESGALLVGEYVVGWAKRGPTGVIGTNKADAMETVAQMLADLPHLTPAPQPELRAVDALLAERNLTHVTIDGWRLLDQLETTAGVTQGRPRVKFTRIQEMLTAMHAQVHVKT
jgi:ferredoxin/flavodoxin---NADP+ reductase